MGGTNPSLVEALGAGCAVIAHNNIFNLWVLNKNAIFFSNTSDLEEIFDTDIFDEKKLNILREQSKENFLENFTWDNILKKYQNLLENK